MNTTRRRIQRPCPQTRQWFPRPPGLDTPAAVPTVVTTYVALVRGDTMSTKPTGPNATLIGFREPHSSWRRHDAGYPSDVDSPGRRAATRVAVAARSATGVYRAIIDAGRFAGRVHPGGQYLRQI